MDLTVLCHIMQIGPFFWGGVCKTLTHFEHLKAANVPGAGLGEVGNYAICPLPVPTTASEVWVAPGSGFSLPSVF